MKKFIVIEGMDGAGTTTQTQLLKSALNEQKILGTFTHEPYQDKISELIRNILSGKEDFQKYKSALTWLYMADREYHLDTCIKPALKEGQLVISDRYFPSTMAYQSGDNSRSICQLYKLFKNSGFLKPDLTVYIRVPVKVCVERLKSRKNLEIFENEEFMKLLYQRYEMTMEILRENGWNIFVVDGLLDPNQINQIILSEILK